MTSVGIIAVPGEEAITYRQGEEHSKDTERIMPRVRRIPDDKARMTIPLG